MAAFFSGLLAKTVSAAHRTFTGLMQPPLFPLSPRFSDSYGSGIFGASRDGGKRSHKGQDFLGQPGQAVFAPIGGKISSGLAYADGRFPDLKLVRISDAKKVVKLMYVLPSVSTGQTVAAGDQIGTVQTLQSKYPGIRDHVHVEVHIAGLAVDPLPYFIQNA